MDDNNIQGMLQVVKNAEERIALLEKEQSEAISDFFAYLEKQKQNDHNGQSEN